MTDKQDMTDKQERTDKQEKIDKQDMTTKQDKIVECRLPEGEITKILDKNTFVVLVKRSTACQGCRACGMLSSESDVRVICNIEDKTKIDTDKLIKGAMVMIEPLDINIIGIATLVYTIPLVTFVLGLGIAKVMGYSDTLCFLSGLVLMCAGFIPAQLINKKYSEQQRPFFRIKKVKTVIKA